MSHQKVRNVMTTDVATVLEGTLFKEVARTMARRDVSAVPVIDEARHVLGVVSEADLLIKQGTQEIEWTRSPRRWWRRRRDRRRAEATRAVSLMSRPAVTVTENTTVASAARTLTKHGVKRLPVVDDDGRLAGIVSRKDVLTVFLRADEDIRDEIVRRVFEGGIGILVSTGAVTVDVRDGEVTLTGQVDLRSQLPLVEQMTRHVDGVVDVVVSLSYRHDDTRVPHPDPMAIDITQAPRVR